MSIWAPPLLGRRWGCRTRGTGSPAVALMSCRALESNAPGRASGDPNIGCHGDGNVEFLADGNFARLSRHVGCGGGPGGGARRRWGGAADGTTGCATDGRVRRRQAGRRRLHPRRGGRRSRVDPPPRRMACSRAGPRCVQNSVGIGSRARLRADDVRRIDSTFALSPGFHRRGCSRRRPGCRRSDPGHRSATGSPSAPTRAARARSGTPPHPTVTVDWPANCRRPGIRRYRPHGNRYWDRPLRGRCGSTPAPATHERTAGAWFLECGQPTSTPRAAAPR